MHIPRYKSTETKSMAIKETPSIASIKLSRNEVYVGSVTHTHQSLHVNKSLPMLVGKNE